MTNRGFPFSVFLPIVSSRSAFYFRWMPNIVTEYPQFFTATNHEWKFLLDNDRCKKIIIDSLRFLVNNKRIRLFGFVIMSNHIHLIWQMQPGIHPANVQRDFLKFTAQQIKFCLIEHNPKWLSTFYVNKADRMFQFWKRNPMSIELRTHSVFLQKLRYIHLNPVRAGMCQLPEQYIFSSARFYHSGVDNWGFLTHYNG